MNELAWEIKCPQCSTYFDMRMNYTCPKCGWIIDLKMKPDKREEVNEDVG